VLRLLPAYYREQWEDEMVAAFLDSWMTGDPYTDECVLEFCKPGWSEAASVVLLAGRLYLGGAGAPRRYLAWGQAVRGAVLAALIVHAVAGLNGLVLVLLPGSHAVRQLPVPPAVMVPVPSVVWPAAVWYVAGWAWIVVFAGLVAGQYRTARILAVLASGADLAWLAQGQLAGALLSPFGSWAFWFLLDLAPVLGMAAFHRDARPAARQPWLLALLATYFLVTVPELAIRLAGHSAWLPDSAGRCCLLVAVLCLVHAPRAWSGRAGAGAWSLTLVLLAAGAAAYRIVSLGDYQQGRYLQDPHLIMVGLAELVILIAAAALVAPGAVSAQAMSAPPLQPQAR
jgi:hypothetical protein